MSSILKALKKIEQERAQQSNDSVNITLDVIKNIETEKTSTRWPWLIVCLCVTTVAVVGMFLWRGVLPTSLNYKEKMIETSAPSGESGSLRPAPAAPLVKKELMNKKVADFEGQMGPTSSIVRHSPTQKQTESINETVVDPQPLVKAVLEEYRLDQIVYHENPSQRLAVINDLPVMEGTMIDKALVREIKPNHVVLLIDMQTTTLSLP